jgi:threonine dehydratase
MNFKKLYQDIEEAQKHSQGVVVKTPLQLNVQLSKRYGASVYLKREDLQVVRSYKIRGAFNKIRSLTDAERKKGVVCASTGNHAQSVAFTCAKFRCKGLVYMPKDAPQQKVSRVRFFGGKWVDIMLVGETFDETAAAAIAYARKHHKPFIPPFDDEKVIAGQGTAGLEICEQLGHAPDYVLIPVGGGGLAAGTSVAIKERYPKTVVMGVEPEGTNAMALSVKKKRLVTLKTIDRFVDGVAVKKVGKLNLKICSKTLKEVLVVPVDRVCYEMVQLYQNDGIVTEPAGALSVAGLESIKNKIRGKTVVCMVSGGNNDINRYQEIVKRGFRYENRNGR